MADLNQIAVTGRVGSDAVLKTLPSGKQLMEVSIANNIGYGDYAKTLWFKCKMFGDRAAKIVQYIKKGNLLAVTGELSTNSWTGKDGTAHTDLEINISNVSFLASPKQEKPEPADYPEDISF